MTGVGRIAKEFEVYTTPNYLSWGWRVGVGVAVDGWRVLGAWRRCVEVVVPASSLSHPGPVPFWVPLASRPYPGRVPVVLV